MTLQLTLPLGNKNDAKSLVFTILTKEYPLKLIELTNFIRKRYGKSVTFQAVRKAVLGLVDGGVLQQEEHAYSINKEWVKNSKKFIDDLYAEVYKEKTRAKSVDSITGEVSVFTFNSLNELMKFWQNLIDDWFTHFKKGDPNLNVYQAAHVWEGILHLDREKELMGQLKRKGIKSYLISTGNTPLDKNIQKFYKRIGIDTKIEHSSSSFDKGYYVGTYGDMIVQAQYPIDLVKELNLFFKKNKTLSNLDLKQLSDIVNKKITMKLTVIKNEAMAKQINKSLIESKISRISLQKRII